MKNYLNPNNRGIEFSDDSEFECTQCGCIHSYSEFEYTPWMCGCGNDLTAAYGAEDICEYPDESEPEDELDVRDDPDYLPNPRYLEDRIRSFEIPDRIIPMWVSE